MHEVHHGQVRGLCLAGRRPNQVNRCPQCRHSERHHQGPRLGVSVAVAANDAAQELLEPGHLLHREGQETDLLGRQQLEALTTSQNMTLKTWQGLPCVTPELPAICERPEA